MLVGNPERAKLVLQNGSVGGKTEIVQDEIMVLVEEV